MTLRTIALLGLSCLFFAACESDGPGVQQVPTEGTISSIIRSPVSAEGVDTTMVAKMEFEEAIYNFGTVERGAVVDQVYRFTNTGNQPLIISNARSTCGCTVPKWPETPIPVGASGEITVRLDTKDLEGKQNKPIQITANTYPNLTEVRLLGEVTAD